MLDDDDDDDDGDDDDDDDDDDDALDRWQQEMDACEHESSLLMQWC
jgi:hypothetical protein